MQKAAGRWRDRENAAHRTGCSRFGRIFEDEAVLDLNYAEDSHAIVDCNVVMTSKGEFIEVQGTGEGRPFTDTELRKLLGLGKRGC